MFPIYVMEDNPKQIEFYRDFISNYIMINDLSANLVYAAQSVDSFKENFEPSENGLFFLDMEIGENSKAGLETAEYIRSEMPFADIVFITTHSEMTLLTLDRRIGPLDYVIKDEGYENIRKHIADDIELSMKKFEQSSLVQKNIFSYKIGSRVFSIPMDDVLMLYTTKENPGKVILVSKTKETIFKSNLNTIEEQFDHLFRTDRSYLVNLDNIESFDIDEKKLFFDNGMEANVSVRKAKELSKNLNKIN
ncbi:LytTR family transcriptional regulator DNA-binding domain-containing protein [Lactobacillus terrae]|uniref:LytTR family transcriptional regulator DNA-binding domain-containing protein n=1 Tax=Lactobacillus terrae TaxID=2269374 RepID=UPI000C1B786D|nr:LytTR family transcriptional regulator DNA-binding domain-containing protein [Lactobacillus terrae]